MAKLSTCSFVTQDLVISQTDNLHQANLFAERGHPSISKAKTPLDIQL
jgi:hypothetical protein